MESTINQRIREIIEKRHEGSANALAKLAGISQSTLKDIIGEKANKPGYDTIVKILKAESNNLFGEISSDWLLFGRGSMVSDVEKPVDKLQKLTARIPTATNNAINYKLVPLLNLDAVGDIHSPNVVPGDYEYPDQLIPFTDALEGDVALTVSGESMSPTCPPGSRVLIRQVPQWREYFGYGNIFVLLLTDGRRILKEVQKYSEDSKNYILCKSHNDKYPEEELPKSMIASVWKVIKILNERGW